MKTFNRTLLALATVTAMGLLMSSCRMEDCPEDNGTTLTGVVSREYAAATPNVMLRIVTPYQQSAANTRATTVKNGDTNEYEVKNGILILFKGNTETTAGYYGAYDIKSQLKFLPDEPVNGAQLTQSCYISQEVTGLENTTDNIYALVMLNCKDLYSTTSFSAGQKLSDISGQMKDFKDTDGGFFMTNAPMYLVKTESGTTTSTVEYLPNVTPFFKDPENARQSDAVTIFVERAAAKVSVAWEKPTTSILANHMEYTNKEEACAKVYDIRWVPDNYNTQSKTVRDFDGTTWLPYGNRFYGSSFVEFKTFDSNTSNAYRTLWGTDKNPSGVPDVSKDQIALQAALKKTSTDYKTNGDVVYMAENTTTAASMTKANTTRIVIAVELADASGVKINAPFYSIRSDGNSAICTSSDHLRAYLKQWWKKKQDGNAIPSDLNDIKTMKPNEVFGAVTFTTSGTDVTWNFTNAPAGVQTLKEKIIGHFEVQNFPDACMYYAYYIRHFNDEETPWTSGDYTDEGHLGRYGVVRDNWYQLTLKEFNNIGSPLPPADGNTKVDE